MSEPVAEAMARLRRFMFEHVYTNPKAKSEEGKAVMLVETLFGYFCKHKDRLSGEMLMLLERGEPLERGGLRPYQRHDGPLRHRKV